MSLHSHDIDLFAPRRIDEARAKKKRTPSKAKGAKRRRPIETKTDLQLPHDVSVHASAHINDPIAMKHHAIASALGRECRTIPGEDASANEHLAQLAKLFTSQPHDTLSTVAARARFGQCHQVSVNSRKWEEQFLHEPTGCERPCVNFASGCCFAGSLQTGELSDLTLTLCEFYVPAEYERIKAAGWDWPKEAKPCLLCLRVEIYSRFIETRCNALSCVESINYATIGNIVGEPGEYTADTCFLSRPDRYEGVLHPVVVPTVFDYGILLVNGSRHLKQKLPYPGDANPSFFF
jgi:hypothetical protein